MDKKAYDLNYISFQIYDLKYMIFWSNLKWSQIYVVPNIWFQIKNLKYMTFWSKIKV